MANYVFNDTTGIQGGMIQECEDICNLSRGDISGNDDMLKIFTRRLNQAGDKFYVIVKKYDSLWKYDDRRYADSDQELPIATTNLLSGVGDYLFDEELLTVEQVFAKDSSGIYHELTPQDDKIEPVAYITRVSGTPTRYELVGNSLILDKNPSYNSTDGLKVVYGRKGANFNYNDGAVAINVPQIFFEYVTSRASLPYVREKGLSHYNALKQDVFEAETIHIPHFFANRAKPKRSGLRANVESNK